MPSGAKKRKAAKKKKEQETNNSTNNNHLGGDELKSIDEKGSDGGEIDSPAHRDHDEDHQFNEVSEVVEVSGPSASVSKSLEQVPDDSKIDETEGGKESVSVIEWDVKSEESCENKDVSVSAVIAESAKESNYGNGKSAVSNNETVTAKNSKDEPNNSVKETVDELVSSVKETVNSVAGSSAEYAKESNYANGKSDGSNNETITAKNSKDEPNNSVKETVAVDKLVNSVNETVNSVDGSSADSLKTVTSVPEVKNGDIENVLLEKSTDSQVVPTDPTVTRNEDNVHPFSDEDVRKSSLEETKTKELDTKVSHCCIPESTNVKDSDTPECSENQPLVESAPQIVHKTSWLSCCGLFEVLSGSNR